MASQAFPFGTEVILWGRSQDNVILLFGQGVYVDDNYINGNMFPVVKLGDGRELTVHYRSVSVGKSDSVAKTCKAFNGVVMDWDIEKFLRGIVPGPDELSKFPIHASSTIANASNGKPVLSEAKTATDKLLNLKREIEYEESKKKLAHTMIESSDKVIASKRAEIATIRDAVLKELAAIDSTEPTVAPVAPTPLVTVAAAPQPLPPEDELDAIARRNALED